MLALLLSLFLQATPLPETASLPQYTPPAEPVRGSLVSVGSSTVSFIMEETTSAFGDLQPGVSFTIEGAGSGTAPPALMDGRAQLAPMSRPMKDAEVEAFTARFGYAPTRVPVAVDAVAIFVNVENPLEGLSLADLDRALGTSPESGRPAVLWRDLGVEDPNLADLPIRAYGLPDNYGVHGIIKSRALGGDPFRSDLRMQYGSSLVAQEVGADRQGLGFTSLFFATARARPLALSMTGGNLVEPTRENILDGSYPLGRLLFVYVNKAPDAPLPPAVAEYLRFVLSAQGQRIIAEAGYYSLPPDLLATTRAELGLD